MLVRDGGGGAWVDGWMGREGLDWWSEGGTGLLMRLSPFCVRFLAIVCAVEEKGATCWNDGVGAAALVSRDENVFNGACDGTGIRKATARDRRTGEMCMLGVCWCGWVEASEIHKVLCA